MNNAHWLKMAASLEGVKEKKIVLLLYNSTIYLAYGDIFVNSIIVK